MDKRAERDYLLSFADEGAFDDAVACDQMVCLWTAFCLHHNLDADTYEYDTILRELWKAVVRNEDDPAFWGGFSAFERALSQYLV